MSSPESVVYNGVTYVKKVNTLLKLKGTRDMFCAVCGGSGCAADFRRRMIGVAFGRSRDYVLTGHEECLALFTSVETE